MILEKLIVYSNYENTPRLEIPLAIDNFRNTAYIDKDKLLNFLLSIKTDYPESIENGTWALKLNTPNYETGGTSYIQINNYYIHNIEPLTTIGSFGHSSNNWWLTRYNDDSNTNTLVQTYRLDALISALQSDANELIFYLNTNYYYPSSSFYSIYGILNTQILVPFGAIINNRSVTIVSDDGLNFSYNGFSSTGYNRMIIIPDYLFKPGRNYTITFFVNASYKVMPTVPGEEIVIPEKFGTLEFNVKLNNEIIASIPSSTDGDFHSGENTFTLTFSLPKTLPANVVITTKAS